VPAIVVTGDTSPSRLKEVTARRQFRILHKPITGGGTPAGDSSGMD
jgi:hypothetical protein